MTELAHHLELKRAVVTLWVPLKELKRAAVKVLAHHLGLQKASETRLAQHLELQKAAAKEWVHQMACWKVDLSLMGFRKASLKALRSRKMSVFN